MSNRTASLLLIVVLVVAVSWLTWWLEDRFGSPVALLALVLIFFLLVVVVVYQMARGQSRETMELLIDFGQKDAMTDRFRSQTTLEAARSMTVEQRLALLDRQEQREALRQQRRLAQQNRVLGPAEVGQYALPGETLGSGYPVQGIGKENYKEFD